MPIWKRKRNDQTPVSPFPEPNPGPVGTDQCSEQRCPNQTGAPCSFVDRRGRRCATSWCPAHRSVVDGKPYCRRHAGVIDALLTSSATGSVPDLANRSPSLANWVANGLDAPIRALLNGAARPSENLVVEAVTLLYYGVDRERRWERSWKLVDHTGVAVKVSIEVDEPTDPEIAVRVANNVVAKGVPPWIEHRRRQEDIPDDLDTEERNQFNAFLMHHITEGVRRERTRS